MNETEKKIARNNNAYSMRNILLLLAGVVILSVLSVIFIRNYAAFVILGGNAVLVYALFRWSKQSSQAFVLYNDEIVPKYFEGRASGVKYSYATAPEGVDADRLVRDAELFSGWDKAACREYMRGSLRGHTVLCFYSHLFRETARRGKPPIDESKRRTAKGRYEDNDNRGRWLLLYGTGASSELVDSVVRDYGEPRVHANAKTNAVYLQIDTDKDWQLPGKGKVDFSILKGKAEFELNTLFGIATLILDKQNSLKSSNK